MITAAIWIATVAVVALTAPGFVALAAHAGFDHRRINLWLTCWCAVLGAAAALASFAVNS